MIRHWRMLLSIFGKRERLQIYLLLANAAVVGLIDVAGVASVMPFIAVLMDDDGLHGESSVSFGSHSPSSELWSLPAWRYFARYQQGHENMCERSHTGF